jgi:diaminopimelate epimerase
MTSLDFSKFHGYGNDYIVIERTNVPSTASLPELARALCGRHTGAGSDGIAVLAADGDGADFTCEIVNPDGSIAGFSGNGTRCAAAYLHYRELWSGTDLRLKTLSGVKNYRLLAVSGSQYEFQAEIGTPKFSSAEVPFQSAEPLAAVIDREIDIAGEKVKISAVNVGNPVACVFVDDFELDRRRLGRKIEPHTSFPEKTNVAFVKVRDRLNIELRIWERGAGETSASGTCSSGAAVLAAQTGRTDRAVAVHTPGGTAKFTWRKDNEMVLTGTASFVYDGRWPLD